MIAEALEVEIENEQHWASGYNDECSQVHNHQNRKKIVE